MEKKDNFKDIEDFIINILYQEIPEIETSDEHCTLENAERQISQLNERMSKLLFLSIRLGEERGKIDSSMEILSSKKTALSKIEIFVEKLMEQNKVNQDSFAKIIRDLQND